MSSFLTPDRLLLEVGSPNPIPANRLPNPSGEKGTSGWSTPTVGSGLNDTTAGLVYTAAGSDDMVRTDAVPVTPGEWIHCRVRVLEMPPFTTYVTALEWLDLDGDPMSLPITQQGIDIEANAYPLNTAPIVVPVGAAAVRWYLTFAGLSAGDEVLFREAQLAGAADPADLATVTRNRFTDVTFAIGGFWSTVGAGTGGGGMLTVTTSGGVNYASQDISNSAGSVQTLAVTALVEPFTGVTPRSVRLRFQVGASAPVYGPTVTENAAGAAPVMVSGTFDVPASSTVNVRVEIITPGGTEKHIYSKPCAVFGPTPEPYFDRDTAWTSTTSYEAAAPSLASNPIRIVSEGIVDDPFLWENVLGATSEIRIVRGALDAGTLQALILDPALDPATATTLRPGVPIRLMFDVDGVVEQVFRARIKNPRVTFNPYRISITAADDHALLGGIPSPAGVATIAELAYLLEGSGVEWSLNGDSSQPFGTPTVVSYNENATVLDQVAITRDLLHGYAWMNRAGVLDVRDADHMDTDVVTRLAEDSYGPDFGADWATSTIINSVKIVFLRFDPMAPLDPSVEVMYGPYEDTDSIRQWNGRYPSTFTIHMPTEDEALIEAFAAEILAQNAQPRRVPRRVTVPLHRTDIADGGTPDDQPDDELDGGGPDDEGEPYDGGGVLSDALLDLYDLVEITNGQAGIDGVYRVTSIEHTIRANNRSARPVVWQMVLGFEADGVAAPPQVIPRP